MNGKTKTYERYLVPDLASGVVVARGSPERFFLNGKLVFRREYLLSQRKQKKGLSRINDSVPQLLSRPRPRKLLNVLDGTNIQHFLTTTKKNEVPIMDMYKYEWLWVKRRYEGSSPSVSRERGQDFCTVVRYRWYVNLLRGIGTSLWSLFRAIEDIAGAIPVRVYIFGFIAVWFASC
jgi:hypothetical protein